VDLKRIGDKARELVDKRGGTDSLKEDAAELREIARGEGSLADKAKAAVEAIKDPGDEGPDPADRESVLQDEPAADAEPGAGERERHRRGRGRGHRRRRAQGRSN
jgi:hypothetical protein